MGLQETSGRERWSGDHQPLLGSGPLALEPRLHPAPDQLDRIGIRIL